MSVASTLSLPVWSRAEAQAACFLAALAPGFRDWEELMATALSELLARPAGEQVRVTRSSALPNHIDDKLDIFTKTDILFGRDADCDLPLPAVSVGSRHARLFREKGKWFLEDLGAPLGTFVNKRRLAAHQIAPVTPGDFFNIFPYRFTFVTEAVWEPGDAPKLFAGSWSAASWESFERSRPPGHRACVIRIHPAAADLVLEVNSTFLSELTSRMFRDAGYRDIAPLPSDAAVFEFVLLSMLDRFNRQLAFPFAAELLPADTPSFDDGCRGLQVLTSVGLTGVTGTLRCFIPLSSAGDISRIAKIVRKTGGPTPAFPFQVVQGTALLAASEVATLAPGDIVLYEPGYTLRAPGSGEAAWWLSPEEGNAGRFRIDNFQERRIVPEEPSVTPDSATAATERLHALPVRLEVLIGTVEMTLAEANQLTPGSIVQLSAHKTEPVTILLNGKACGEGELVEIEGHFGVRVLNWGTS
jgi:flagellar motor switch/type III secretory pathway protein FliN